jgi:hypothetical protein
MDILHPLNKVMIVMRLLLLSLGLMVACSRSSINKELDSSDSIVTISVNKANSLYAQTDSAFQINGQSIRVNVKQFDLTETATHDGDTLSRPTYSCIVRITDENKKELFKDSLLRDSWGYKGKIVPIDYYTLAFPLINRINNEIIFSFHIAEQADGDAIEGSVAFDVTTSRARYFFREATSEE